MILTYFEDNVARDRIRREYNCASDDIKYFMWIWIRDASGRNIPITGRPLLQETSRSMTKRAISIHSNI